jgi:hypothetical protein
MILKLILIMWKAITAVIPSDACGALEEVLEVAEGLVEALGMAFRAPVGGWTAGGCELRANHVSAGLCVAFEELGMLEGVSREERREG